MMLFNVCVCVLLLLLLLPGGLSQGVSGIVVVERNLSRMQPVVERNPVRIRDFVCRGGDYMVSVNYVSHSLMSARCRMMCSGDLEMDHTSCSCWIVVKKNKGGVNGATIFSGVAGNCAGVVVREQNACRFAGKKRYWLKKGSDYCFDSKFDDVVGLDKGVSPAKFVLKLKKGFGNCGDYKLDNLKHNDCKSAGVDSVGEETMEMYHEYFTGKLGSFLKNLKMDKYKLKNGYSMWSVRNFSYILTMGLLMVFAYVGSRNMILYSILYFIISVLVMLVGDFGYIFSLGYAALGAYALTDSFSERERNLYVMSFAVSSVQVGLFYITNVYFVYAVLLLVILTILVSLLVVHNSSRPVEGVRGVIMVFMMVCVLFHFAEAFLLVVVGNDWVVGIVSLVKYVITMALDDHLVVRSSLAIAYEVSVLILSVRGTSNMSKDGFALMIISLFCVVVLVRLKLFYTFLTRNMNLYSRVYVSSDYLAKQLLQFESVVDALLDVAAKFDMKSGVSTYISFLNAFYMVFMVVVVLSTHVEFFVCCVILWVLKRVMGYSRPLNTYDSRKCCGLMIHDIQKIMDQSVGLSVPDDRGGYNCGSGMVDGNEVFTVGHLGIRKGGKLFVDGNVQIVEDVKETVDSESFSTRLNSGLGFIKDKLVQLSLKERIGNMLPFKSARSADLVDGVKVVLFSKKQNKVFSTEVFEVVFPFIKYKLGTCPGDSGEAFYFVNGKDVLYGGNHSQGDQSREGWSIGMLNSCYVKEGLKDDKFLETLQNRKKQIDFEKDYSISKMNKELEDFRKTQELVRTKRELLAFQEEFAAEQARKERDKLFADRELRELAVLKAEKLEKLKNVSKKEVDAKPSRVKGEGNLFSFVGLKNKLRFKFNELFKSLIFQKAWIDEVANLGEISSKKAVELLSVVLDENGYKGIPVDFGNRVKMNELDLYKKLNSLLPNS